LLKAKILKSFLKKNIFRYIFLILKMTQNEWIGLFIIILISVIILTTSLILSYVENRNTSIPGAPTITTIVSGNNRLEIYFRAPSNPGGSPITAYEYSLDNGKTFIRVENTNSPILVNSGVTNETTYPVILRAINAFGTSPNSNTFNATPSDAMQFSITTTNSIKTISLPFSGITSLTVDWGDGSAPQTFTSGPVNHTYASVADYNIRITGSATGFGSSISLSSRNLFTSISQWGDLGLTSLAYAFNNFDNLTSVPNYLPSTVTNISSMFRNTDSFNDGNIVNWNTENITDMNFMFYGATNFNQDIGQWNTGLVKDMNGMFYGADNFNQDIGQWNVGLVESMNDMFSGAKNFNQDIGQWNVGLVKSMNGMFYGADNFNQDIGQWNVGLVESMNGMFYGADNFNQDISGWLVGNVSSAENIFCGAAILGQTAKYPNFPTPPSNYGC